MKCKDCDYCSKNMSSSKSGAYVTYTCIGVKEPFIISDIDVECTEYPDRRALEFVNTKTCLIKESESVKPYVDDRGIYVPYELNPIYHRQLMSRELFVEAYNKWIKQGNIDPFMGQDSADDWCD